MKIRNGFVSNSSSSSFIIALTRDFKPPEEGLQNFINQLKEYYDIFLTTEQAYEKIKDIVEVLCKEEQVWLGGWQEVPGIGVFLSIFEKDIAIGVIPVGPEAEMCFNIFADKNINKVLEKSKKVRKNENT